MGWGLVEKAQAHSIRLSQKTITSGDLPRAFEDNCKRIAPFMKFLSDAVGVPF